MTQPHLSFSILFKIVLSVDTSVTPLSGATCDDGNILLNWEFGSFGINDDSDYYLYSLILNSENSELGEGSFCQIHNSVFNIGSYHNWSNPPFIVHADSTVVLAMYNTNGCYSNNYTTEFELVTVFYKKSYLDSINSVTKNELDFGIYPVPGDEFINLNFNTSVKGKLILINSNGATVLESEINGSTKTINTQQLSSGNYTLIFRSHNNLIRKQISIK